MRPRTYSYDESVLRSLWQSGKTYVEIADALGIQPTNVYWLKARHRLPPRPRNRTAPPAGEITPAEIQAACERIRSTWSESTRRRRISLSAAECRRVWGRNR